MRITTTSTESTESTWVGARVDSDGGLCVPARLLTELVATLPTGAVSLSATEGRLVISCGNSTATIPGVPTSEFPPIPALKQTNATTIPRDGLGGALALVLYAAATDEGRPMLTGVKMRSEEDSVLLAATDGYRLSVKRMGLRLKQDVNMVVPARALGEVARVALEEKDVQSVFFSQQEEHQVVFQVGDTQVVTRTIDGEYPGFDKIIPKSFTTRVHLEKDALARAVKSAAVFARDNANIVRWVIEGQKVIVSAATAALGENKVELDAQVDGEGGEIAFNSRFLLEFLGNYPEDELLFEMTGALNPGAFRPVKDDSFVHIIMPIRTSQGSAG